MRRLILTLLLAGLSPALAAQNHNRFERENWPWLVFSNSKHPVTQQNYAYPPTQPPEYSVPGSGVPAGTYTFKAFDACTSKYGLPTAVSGFTYVARNSAATLAPNQSSYIYEWDLRPTVPRPGGGIDRDMSRSFINVPSVPGGGTTLTYRVSVTFQPVSVVLTSFAMTLRWQGGEQRDKDANAGQGPSQNIAATWMDGPMPYVPDGFVDPAGNITYNTDPRFHKWITLLVERMVVAAHSNWGARRGGYDRKLWMSG